jgi:SAM-dependent methyltransferase
VADVTQYEVAPGQGFDFVLANSLLHHLNDEEVAALLGRMAGLLRADGRVHIIELVLPKERGVPRALARWDRGRYARPLETWHEIFCRHFSCEVFDPFTVSKAGIALWNFVYFRGGRRS